jgi:hypothetical protein
MKGGMGIMGAMILPRQPRCNRWLIAREGPDSHRINPMIGGTELRTLPWVPVCGTLTRRRTAQRAVPTFLWFLPTQPDDGARNFELCPEPFRAKRA